MLQRQSISIGFAGLSLLASACGGGSDTLPTISAPGSLSASLVSDTQVDLSWSDTSSDEAGFRVERRGPNETDFAAIASLDADATSYSDTAPLGGLVEWRVIAEAADDNALENASNVASATVPLPAQVATLSVNLATQAVTVATQASNLRLSATSAPIGPGGALAPGAGVTLSLSVENGTGRVVYNVKAVARSVNDNVGLVAAASTGYEYDGDPMAHFGNAGVDLGASVEQTMDIVGVDDTATTLDVEIELFEHALVLASDSQYDASLYAFDSSGVDSDLSTSFDLNQFTFGGSSGPNSGVIEGVMSLDGRKAYFGVRNQPAILVVDLLTLTPMLSGSLAGGTIKHDETGVRGMTRAVTMSPDGQFLYVTLTTKAHAYESSSSTPAEDDSSIEIVKLNRETLAEVGRVVLLNNISAAQGRRLSLSADGSVGAVAIKIYTEEDGTPVDQTHGRFFVINTSDMSIVDGDAAATHQSFDVSSRGNLVNQATMSADGKTVYVASTDETDSFLSSVDLATGAVTPIAESPYGGRVYSRELEVGPDGRLYWMGYYNSYIYDLSDSSWIDLGNGVSSGIEFVRSGLHYVNIHSSSSELRVNRVADDSIVTAPADGGDVRGIDSIYGHAAVMSPF